VVSGSGGRSPALLPVRIAATITCMRLLRRLAVATALVGGLSAFAHAQWGVREGSFAPRFAPPAMPDGGLTFCRLMYARVRSEPLGMGWMTDYPYAEINLLTRLSELTKTAISRDERREPNHWVVRLTDDALFNCPITLASDVGTMGLTPPERERLRLYLLKGGFLWVDDFWGTEAWEHWSSEVAAVLPPAEYPIQEVPCDDPVFRTQLTLDHVPQITSIQFWRGVGGTTTSERGTDSQDAHLRVIRDSHGRIMVLMTHNTDVADSWEREGEDPAFFRQFSPSGYALGINVVLHTLTH
jgi:hypothetical protein